MAAATAAAAAGSCLLWDTDEAVDPEHPDLLALQALQLELSPLERALAYRQRGNEALRRGNAVNLRHAVAFYMQALGEGCGDAGADAAALANRAQAQLLLKNYGRALDDARAALALAGGCGGAEAEGSATPAAPPPPPAPAPPPPALLAKAAFRGATAAAALGRDALARDLALRGLALQPLDAALLAARAAAEARLAAAAARSAAASALAAAVRAAGVRCGPPQPGLPPGLPARPWLGGCDGEEGRLCSALVLCYPEAPGSDAAPHPPDLVECVDLCGHTLSDHLASVLPPDAPPPPWDHSGQYAAGRVRAYVRLAGPGAAAASDARLAAWLAGGSGDDAAAAAAGDGAWAEVDPGAPLAAAASAAGCGGGGGCGGALSGGALVLSLLARGGAFEAEWLRGRAAQRRAR